MKVKEMEAAYNAGNSRRLFQLIRSTAPQKPSVSETIKGRTGIVITNQSERMDRWADHFEQQFGWPSAPSSDDVVGSSVQWDVEVKPPTLEEIRSHISHMQRRRAAGSDNLPPSLFKDGGEALCESLFHLCVSIWSEEKVPKNWGESTIIPIFKKGSREECGNHRGISLTPVVTRLLASIILHRLLEVRESSTREQQAGFRPGRGCIDHIFTLRQVLEQRHMYKQPTISIFLDFKGAFDSVDRKVLFNVLVQHGVPMKFVNIIRSMYSQTSGRVRAYGELSKTFPTMSGVRQGCPLSPFLFNFIIDEIMKRALEDLENPGVQLAQNENLVDLEYADDVVLIFDNQVEAQECLNRLSITVPAFGMRFAPTKCQVMLQDCAPLIHPLELDGIPLEVVDCFTYLGSCISSDCSVSNEVNARIRKARITFANLRHLWRQKSLSLSLKARVYQATVRAVLLYGCETWANRVQDLRKLQVFDNRCLRTIAGFGWYEKIRNTDVHRRIFGSAANHSLGNIIRRSQLRWLGHVLRMPNHRLPKRALLSVPHPEWRKSIGGQRSTWLKEIKQITKSLRRRRCRTTTGMGSS